MTDRCKSPSEWSLVSLELARTEFVRTDCCGGRCRSSEPTGDDAHPPGAETPRRFLLLEHSCFPCCAKYMRVCVCTCDVGAGEC